MKNLLLLIIVLFGFCVFSDDSPSEAKLKFPRRLYINEICIRPEKDGYPNWIELWNHTDKEINLKGWSFETKRGKFKINDDFIIPSEKLGLILLYLSGEKSEEFEAKLPRECPIIRFFRNNALVDYLYGKEYTDDYANYSDFVKERLTEARKAGIEFVNNRVFLFDTNNELVATAIWGVLDNNYSFAYSKKLDAVYVSELIKLYLHPGFTMWLISKDRYISLQFGTSTPGAFYPKRFKIPIEVEVSYRSSLPTPSYLMNYPPNYKSDHKPDVDPFNTRKAFSGVLYFHCIGGTGGNYFGDGTMGWELTPVCEICYDNESKTQLLRDTSLIDYYWVNDSFSLSLSFEDCLYLAGKKLSCRVGRKNINGEIVWSQPKSFVIPKIEEMDLNINTISGSISQINHLDDVEYLKKVNALVSRLKTVVNAIGVFNTYRFHETLDKGGKMGHLKELKISPDLSSVYMHIYLHNFQCLKQNPSTNLVNCGGNTNDLYKILTPVKDFSFLKGFENLRLDLSENDIPAMGGLELVLKELNKYCKPKGLKLELTRLEDISALKGISVEKLNISFNYDLKDISPLSGAPNLKMLNIEKVARREKIDLSPLASCPKLEVLKFSPEGCENISALKKIPTLKEINGESAEDFFKRNGL